MTHEIIVKKSLTIKLKTTRINKNIAFKASMIMRKVKKMKNLDFIGKKFKEDYKVRKE